MGGGSRAAWFALLLLASPAGPTSVTAQTSALPESSLAVLRNGEWQRWWHAAAAPPRWSSALPTVADAAAWERLQPGLDHAELELAGEGVAWRLRVILVRLDPRHFQLRLVESLRDAGMRGDWAVEFAPPGAAVALNAGQFTGGLPWGWVVRDGKEVRPPGDGPLSMALVMDAAGGVRLVRVDSIESIRADPAIREAFQSYSALLWEDGRVPEQLTGRGRGVNVDHRDSRLAIGELRDGRILIALTRFAGFGAVAGALPFGPTTPEMAALMGALGCREAMLLDGGLSGQLAISDAHGETHAWKGWRRVPLGLLAFPIQRPRRPPLPTTMEQELR
jgi:hypothetical protein